MSNKFAVLGEMEEAQSQKKKMILSQYKLIFSILENCMQLKEDGAVREVLQKQAETMKLLQKEELPKQSEDIIIIILYLRCMQSKTMTPTWQARIC